MLRRITKLTSAMGLALGLGIAFTPLGCGGSQEVGMELSHGAGEGPQAPAETVAKITDCVNEAKARLTDTSYAMQFNVEVTESGHAGRVKLKDSSPGERRLESCIARALEGMTSPVPAMRLISQQPVSPESRGLGQPLPAIAVGSGGALAPIFILAAGITVIVAVTLYVAEEVAEAERRRRKIKEQCMELLVECLNTPKQPEWNRGTFGDRKACRECFAICKRENGKWPLDKCPPPWYRPN
jgi:hypothetical protein